jgi:hypothetical protein
MPSRISPKTVLYGLSWITILATLVTMSGCYYLYFFDGNPPIDYLNAPFPVDRAVYRPGDTITMLVKYDRHVSAPVTRSVYLNDSYPIPLELTQDGEIMPVGTGTVLLTYVIPPSYVPAQGDDYHLSGTSSYHVNFLRDRVVTWESEDFRIDPAAGTSPRPSAHHPVQGTEVKDQRLIDLIEHSHPSSASLSSAPVSESSAPAPAPSSVGSVSSSSSGLLQGVVAPVLDGAQGAVRGVDNAVNQVAP